MQSWPDGTITSQVNYDQTKMDMGVSVKYRNVGSDFHIENSKFHIESIRISQIHLTIRYIWANVTIQPQISTVYNHQLAHCKSTWERKRICDSTLKHSRWFIGAAIRIHLTILRTLSLTHFQNVYLLQRSYQNTLASLDFKSLNHPITTRIQLLDDTKWPTQMRMTFISYQYHWALLHREGICFVCPEWWKRMIIFDIWFKSAKIIHCLSVLLKLELL